MKARRTYEFKVTCFVEGAPSANSSASLQVLAKASPLFASVAGGTARLQSRLRPLVLDGGGSKDPDQPTSTAHLTFAWTCYDISTRDACTNAANGTLLVLGSSPRAELQARALAAGFYRLTLVVACPLDGRNASATVVLELAATEVKRSALFGNPESASDATVTRT
jgi:hypothetical protein